MPKFNYFCNSKSVRKNASWRKKTSSRVTAVVLAACSDPKDEHLWQASMRGQTDSVRQFIRAGADPNYVRGGWSILMRVAREGRAEIAEILIENGAHIDFKGKDGASALTIAAEHGNTAVAKVLLAKGGAVNIRNDHGNTALMYGAEYGHREIVQLLLASGADIAAKDMDGETALMIAQRRGHVIIVGLLQDAAAKKRNANALEGSSPMPAWLKP